MRWPPTRSACLGLLLLAALADVRAAAGATPAPATAAPQRIVSMAPAVTETLYALGLGERVVGVSDYTVWPPAAASLPRLGGLFDPNLEAIFSLRPDLVILIPSQADLATRLGGLAIASLTVRCDTLADVEAMFLAVATRCGVDPSVFLTEWRQALAPRAPPLGGRVAVLIGRQPGELGELLTVGPGSFLAELLDRLGVVNVFADAPTAYPTVSAEELLVRNPDTIVEIESEVLTPAAGERLLGDWRRAFGDLAAVRRGRIRLIDADYTMLPGPRLPQLYARLAAALAP
jgi:iron complex transport system substrate-binding protein